MTNKPKLAIVLEFGFHEIKKYIHSGFAKDCAKEFDIVWIALDKGSVEFDSYFRATGFPLVYVDETEVLQPVLKIEQYNTAIRKNWLAQKNLGAFHNHSTVKTKNWKTRIKGNSLVKLLLEKWTLKKVKQHYFNSKIAAIYEEHDLDLLFTTGCASSFAKATVITAQQQGIGIYYLVNSWKDLYINNFLPFQGIKGIFVWSERMKQEYMKQMPYLKNEVFVTSGNPTFDVLIDPSPSKDRSFYAEKYKLQLTAKWMLYSMMPVGITTDEIETIRFTAEELLKNYSPEEVMILVRKNPTHQKTDFTDMDLPPNIRIVEHFCSFDKVNDMIVQSPEGEREWLDLLLYCDVNLSVPSTVTLEFMNLQKPVLNVAYNATGEEDLRIKQFFRAGFYRPLFDTNSVIKINHPEEINKFLQNKSTISSDVCTPSSVRAATIIIDSLKK